jgi:hypothetical protein
MLCVALLPHFIPFSGATLANGRVLESWIAMIDHSNACKSHIITFLLMVLELVSRSSLFFGARSFFAPLVTFVRRISRQRGIVADLALVALSVLHTPPVTVAQARDLEKKSAFSRRFEVHGVVITLCENTDDDQVVLVVRGPAGLSIFEVLPAPGEREPEPEDGMKPTVLRRAQIDLSGGPFPAFVEPPPLPPKSRALAFLSRLGLLEPESRVRPRPLKAEATSLIDEFDKLCQPIQYPVPVACVVNDTITKGTSPGFAHFLTDLGESYSLGICEFAFTPLDTGIQRDFAVIFNDSGLRLSRCSPDLSKLRLVCVVEPMSEGLTRQVPLYRIRVAKASETYYVVPYTLRRARIVSAKNLGLALAVLFFFFVAQCEPDPGNDVPKCDLATRIVERAAQKENLLATIVREMTEDEDILNIGTS